MLFFRCFLLVQLLITALSQPDFFLLDCSNNANYTNDSVYKKNLETALFSISSNTQIDYGFYNFTAGEDPDKVYAVALCRGTTPLQHCRSCVNESTHRIRQVCPNQKEAKGWLDDCQIRYSNKSFYGVRDSAVLQSFFNVEKASDPNGFNGALRSLLDRLQKEAAAGTSIRKSANGDTSVPSPSFDRIYAMVDCTPDLSFLDCSGCLSLLMSFIPGCCNGSISARIVTTSCQLEYQNRPFFDPSPPPPPPAPVGGALSPPRSSTEGEKNSSTRMVRIIVIPIICVTTLMIIIIYIFMRIWKRKSKKALEEVENDISSIDNEMLQFDFDAVRLATDDFSNENKLGQGGFGAVYKGKLPNGKTIAVKRLANDSQQGDSEFRNEVLLVAKLQHRNLVRLLGFCFQRNERLLIYEFVPNGSLDHFIFDPSKRFLLDWTTRTKIIMGISRGLLYLHEDSQLRIVHRDLKTSNILLDAEMNPKIADFGMARLFGLDETRGRTNRVVGTFGYMAPEYAIHGRFSTKSDVFSFGVLVLEIITGQKVHHFHDGENNPEDLLTFAWNKWREGRGLDIIDSTIMGRESRVEIMRCIHIGLLCVQENEASRPTIASVVVMLNSHSQSLPLPSRPAFFMQSVVEVSSRVANPDHSLRTRTQSKSSQDEALITDLYPR